MRRMRWLDLRSTKSVALMRVVTRIPPIHTDE